MAIKIITNSSAALTYAVTTDIEGNQTKRVVDVLAWAIDDTNLSFEAITIPPMKKGEILMCKTENGLVEAK